MICDIYIFRHKTRVINNVKAVDSEDCVMNKNAANNSFGNHVLR